MTRIAYKDLARRYPRWSWTYHPDHGYQTAVKSLYWAHPFYILLESGASAYALLNLDHMYQLSETQGTEITAKESVGLRYKSVPFF